MGIRIQEIADEIEAKEGNEDDKAKKNQGAKAQAKKEKENIWHHRCRN